MSNFAPNLYTTAGSKQVNELPIIFAGFQVKDSLIQNKIYTDDSGINAPTGSGTATSESIYSEKAPAGDLYGTVYDPSNSNQLIPLVGRATPYTRVTAALANEFEQWAVNWDMTLDNMLVIVHKATSTAVAGKLTVRSSAGNESVCSFTTSATAGTWARTYIYFKDGTDPNVTISGTPVWASINELEVSVDAPGSIDVAMVYGANSLYQIIGTKIDYTHGCVSEFALEDALEAAGLSCGQQIVQKTGSSREVTLTVGAKKKDISALAMAMGDVLVEKAQTISTIINSTTVGKRAVSSGTIQLQAGLNIGHVRKMDGSSFAKADSATLVKENEYFYDSATGVMTFHSTMEGQTPYVIAWTTKTMVSRTARNLDLGFVGFLQVPRKTESGKYEYITAKKAQVMLEAEGINDDFDQVNFNYSFFPVGGEYYTIGTEL